MRQASRLRSAEEYPAFLFAFQLIELCVEGGDRFEQGTGSNTPFQSFYLLA